MKTTLTALAIALAFVSVAEARITANGTMRQGNSFQGTMRQGPVLQDKQTKGAQDTTTSISSADLVAVELPR